MPTFISGWRLIWSQDREGIERKRALWQDLGIQTEPLSKEELRKYTLLRDDIPLYGLKVLGDGKFFANVDEKICAYLTKTYPHFSMRTAAVRELYIDPVSGKPYAVQEGSGQVVAVDSFFGSPGHNQLFKEGSKKPLWEEVPVSGVSSLWVCTIEKSLLQSRLGDIKEFPGAANLTNFHMTIWDVAEDGQNVHILIRATEGANFNSEYADPDDLANMQANIQRFFIGSWKLISAGSCTRKTTIANIPEIKEHFIHGLSGIGFSFSAANFLLD